LVTASTSKTRLRKIDTVDDDNAVATYEATRDGRVLGTITKYDEPAYKMTKRGPRDYRLISWRHSLDVPYSAQNTRAACIIDLERTAGVTS
jgi:hypothetical protein